MYTSNPFQSSKRAVSEKKKCKEVINLLRTWENESEEDTEVFVDHLEQGLEVVS